jgi:hypothetical protein
MHGSEETVKTADHVAHRFRELPGDQFESYGKYCNAQGMFRIGGRYWTAYAPWMYATCMGKQESDGSWPNCEAGRI